MPINWSASWVSRSTAAACEGKWCLPVISSPKPFSSAGESRKVCSVYDSSEPAVPSWTSPAGIS